MAIRSIVLLKCFLFRSIVIYEIRTFYIFSIVNAHVPFTSRQLVDIKYLLTKKHVLFSLIIIVITPFVLKCISMLTFIIKYDSPSKYEADKPY